MELDASVSLVVYAGSVVWGERYFLAATTASALHMQKGEDTMAIYRKNSICKRKDGRLQIVVTFVTPEGKKRKTIYGHSEQELLEIAQEILGHSDITTTMAIYTHTYSEDVRGALERVGREL